MNIFISTLMLTAALVAFTTFHIVAMCFVLTVALIAPMVDATVWSGRASLGLFRRRAAVTV